MSKAVMISIKPEWCKLIADGEKTLEIRKTAPKLGTPFKVYIYCTKPKSKNDLGLCLDKGDFGNLKEVGFVYKCNYETAKILNIQILSGKVIGEFICDGFHWFGVPYPAFQNEMDKEILKRSCCEYYPLHRYAHHDTLVGWSISNLVIYDEPKELSKFYISDNAAIQSCKHREIVGQPEYKTAHNGWIKGSYICNANGEPDWCTKCKVKPIIRPPQSWFYVEELNE